MGTLMTVDDVARYLRVSKSGVYRWVTERKLPALRAGHLLRFRSEDVEAFLKRELKEAVGD